MRRFALDDVSVSSWRACVVAAASGKVSQAMAGGIGLASSRLAAYRKAGSMAAALAYRRHIFYIIG